jgi:hypothetical protein
MALFSKCHTFHIFRPSFIENEDGEVTMVTADCYRNITEVARFEVFTAAKIQVEVFWIVMPCSVEVGQ